MQQYIQHILLFLVLLSLAKTQTLTQNYKNNKLIVEISSEENEILIDFYNQDNLFFDQLFCKVQECLCFFTKENINSSILREPECQNQKLILERSVANLTANINVTTKRIMAEAYTDADMTDSKVIDSRLTLKWKFNSDSTIEFATIWNKKTWLGIGFGSNMKNIDMITINVVGTSVEMIDLYSTSDSTPPTDSSQDYSLISFEVGSATVKTRFKRKLSTGDSKDKTLTSGSSYNWCYAYSSGLTMEMHTVQLGFSITLTNSATSSSSGTGTSTSGTGTSTSGTGTSTSGTGTSTSTSGTDTTSSGTSSSTSSSGTETTTSSSSSESESEQDSDSDSDDSDSDSESTDTTSGATYSYKSTSYGTISLALFSLVIYLL